jgi:glycosyltransferase involved in cell wall biosynthesis
MLSIVIITLNEEEKIRDCLESIKWADEIIVVDSFSRDRTVGIASEYTDKIYQREFADYGEQKTFTLSKANGDWILSIDADERVTPELQEEIRRTLVNPRACGYYIPRKSCVSGTWIRHCGWWPDYHLRLFRRDCGRFSSRLVHEAEEVDGPTAKLKNPVEHYAYSSVSDLLRKAQSYSSLGARAMVEEGKTCSCCNALTHSTAALLKAYFLRMGILDSWRGLAIAYSNTVGVFYKYMKGLEKV